MEIYNISKARESLFKIVKDVQDDCDEVWILGKECKAVVISEAKYESMQESIKVFGHFYQEYREKEKKRNPDSGPYSTVEELFNDLDTE